MPFIRSWEVEPASLLAPTGGGDPLFIRLVWADGFSFEELASA
jgi:hypothetical protein